MIGMIENPATDNGIPYFHLNLRFNPFGRFTPEEEAAIALPSFDSAGYAARLRQPGTAVQFLGPSGRGKTTHVLALRRHFPEASYTYIGRGQPIPPLPEVPILFLDEMQRVPRRQRRELLSRRAAYVIGSHTDHSREFARAELDYEVIPLGPISAGRLRAILNRRVEFARRHPNPPIPKFSLQAAEMLIDSCGADQWAMNGILYDIFESLPQTDQLEEVLGTFLLTYRLPWQRRLLKLETPALAGLIEFIVR